MNELAGAALPSQKFGANAAWLRFNVTLYNLLSAFKRIPPDPSGYASCCSTPSARSSAMPARPSCAAPRRSPESSPERREPASPSNARLSRGLRNPESERRARNLAREELDALGGDIPVFASVDYYPSRKESHRINTTSWKPTPPSHRI